MVPHDHELIRIACVELQTNLELLKAEQQKFLSNLETFKLVSGQILEMNNKMQTLFEEFEVIRISIEAMPATISVSHQSAGG